LLIQALEGLYGYEKRFAAQQAEFTPQRESVLSRCKHALEVVDFRFIKRYLPKRRPQGLDGVLREMLRALPTDLESELASSDLVSSVPLDPSAGVNTALDVIRVVRNDLSHGNRTYDRHALGAAADILERVVRGHLLRLLEVSESAINRVLRPRS
jgi:hypothetical protein